jgi:hypothetical protein
VTALAKKKDSKKAPIDIEKFDLSRMFRVGDKISAILDKKIKNPIERYLVLKMLCISFEEAGGFVLSTEDETRIREIARDDSLDDAE